MKENKTQLFGLKPIYTLLAGITAWTVISSCSNNENFTIGDEFIESVSSIQTIDTFSVAMSTIIFDSLPTSNTGTLLCGINSDNISGTTYCQPFFQIGLPNNPGVQSDEVYDSTRLFLSYSHTFYGDTLLPQTIYVRRLTGDLKQQASGYYYNISDIACEANPLGIVQFTPLPRNETSIRISIDDDIAEVLFSGLKNVMEVFANDEAFVTYFKGMTLVPEKTTNSVILGFKATTAGTYMRMYSHRVSSASVVIVRDFPLINANLQFNRIISDRSNTLLSSLSTQRHAISSDLMSHLSFIQGGIGLMTKIQFPTLPQLQLMDKMVILKAELILKPEPGTYDTHTLPDSLMMYNTNKVNSLGSAIYSSANNISYAFFVRDDLYHEKTSYSFDVTGFIKNEFFDKYFDVEHGILVTIPMNDFLTKFDRVVLSAKTQPPVLKILVMTY